MVDRNKNALQIKLKEGLGTYVLTVCDLISL